jgi:hypothetical protein
MILGGQDAYLATAAIFIIRCRWHPSSISTTTVLEKPIVVFWYEIVVINVCH